MVGALHIQSRFFHSLVMLVIIPLGCRNKFMIQGLLDLLEAVAPVSSGCDVIVPEVVQPQTSRETNPGADLLEVLVKDFWIVGLAAVRVAKHPTLVTVSPAHGRFVRQLPFTMLF